MPAFPLRTKSLQFQVENMGENANTFNVVKEHLYPTVNEGLQDLFSRDPEGEAGRGPSHGEGS